MRAEKKSIVDEIKGRLEDHTMFILADYSGLSSSKLNDLRAVLRKSDSQFIVVKNSLLKRVFDTKTRGALEDTLVGPTALIFSRGDVAVLSKTVVDFARNNEAPAVKAGFMDGSFLSAAQVGTIASLPSREMLIAKFIGGMQAPLTSFVGGLKEIVRRFVSVVDQAGKKRSVSE
jgi:large subunit ribosomal protein L10